MDTIDWLEVLVRGVAEKRLTFLCSDSPDGLIGVIGILWGNFCPTKRHLFDFCKGYAILTA